MFLTPLGVGQAVGVAARKARACAMPARAMQEETPWKAVHLWLHLPWMSGQLTCAPRS